MRASKDEQLWIAVILAVAALVMLASCASAEKIAVDLPDGGTLYLRAEKVNGRVVPKVLGQIPDMPLGEPEYASDEDQRAYFAQCGNEVWQRVRETQKAHGWAWVEGYLSATPYRMINGMEWPPEQTVSMLAIAPDTLYALNAVEIIGGDGRKAAGDVQVIMLYPGGYNGYYFDFQVSYGPGYSRATVVVAFPPTGKRRWLPEDVVAVNVTGGE